MCGITGAILKDNNNKYLDLLKASEIRGQDGTGIALLRDDLKNDSFGVAYFKVARSEKKASEAIDSLKKDLGFEPGKNDLVVGQNRLAIFGLDHKNDQPLVTERYAIVHNGNLFGFEEMFEKFYLKREYQVDTELILRLIEKFNTLSLEDVITRFIFPNVKGNYACIVIDAVQRCICAFTRFKPLFYYEDASGLYFFSTERIGNKVFPGAVFTEIQNETVKNFQQYL